MKIIGGNLDLAFTVLGLSAIKLHETEKDQWGISLQVWELEDDSWYTLSMMDEDSWKDEYGWWRNSRCNYRNKLIEFKINNESMIGYKEEIHYLHEPEYETNKPIEFKSLYDYFTEYIGISKYENFTYFIHSLAEINGMSKAEMLKKYW